MRLQIDETPLERDPEGGNDGSGATVPPPVKNEGSLEYLKRVRRVLVKTFPNSDQTPETLR